MYATDITEPVLTSTATTPEGDVVAYGRPERPMLPFTMASIQEITDDILKLEIEIDFGAEAESITWTFPQTHIATFFSRLTKLKGMKSDHPELTIANPENTPYIGLKLHFFNKENRPYETVFLYNGDVSTTRGLLATDVDRKLEYWVFGINTSYANRLIAAKGLPIISFKECVLIGNPIVETTPRQCLMANGDIFLDIEEMATQKALSVTNFDTCLNKGEAIINTFPRRCITAGGHVFTEPPRLPEAPVLRKEFSMEDFTPETK